MHETYLSQDGYMNWIQNSQKKTELIIPGEILVDFTIFKSQWEGIPWRSSG